MSEQPAKRQKRAPEALASVPAIGSLPPELLETILGFLDVRTLCTARLVCTQFRVAASWCIQSVEVSVETVRTYTLRPDTYLKHFKNLSRVSVFDVGEFDLAMLAQSPVAAAIAHVRAVSYLTPLPQCAQTFAGFPLLPLPNLTSLTVKDTSGHALAFPQSLRELSLAGSVTERAANFVTRLSNLTCLRIDIPALRKPYTGLAALTALQMLDIRSELSLIPSVAELMQLTHLQFREVYMRASLSDLGPLASMTRLRKLVHLGVKLRAPSLEAETAIIAILPSLTAVHSLDLSLCPRPQQSPLETVYMAQLSQLTALCLQSYDLEASFLPRFKLERLQSLSLSHGVQLDRDGVVALRRATGLTLLKVSIPTVSSTAGFEELGIALSHMSRLRALCLGFYPRQLPGIVFGHERRCWCHVFPQSHFPPWGLDQLGTIWT